MSREELFDDLFGDKPKHELGKHTPENEKFKKENLPAKYSKPEAQKNSKKYSTNFVTKLYTLTWKTKN